MDYVNLYLIHFPVPLIKAEDYKNPVFIPHHVAWAQLEECVKNGLTKSIGLSNFNTQTILNVWTLSQIKPAVLQIELSPYLQQRKLVEFCHKMGIAITAYSPLCKGHEYKNIYGADVDIFKEPIL